MVSSTRAFADEADRYRDTLEEQLKQVAPHPSQVGLAAVHGGEVVALNLFGSAGLYSRAWRKVTRGLLLEQYPVCGPDASAEQATSTALSLVQETPVTRKEAPGVGQTLHGEHGNMVVGAVVHQGKASTPSPQERAEFMPREVPSARESPT